MSKMHTFTGRLVDPLTLQPQDVVLEDIAHHLANTCRFNGATPVFYSVAEHASRVAALVEYLHGPEVGILALHHDDAEAYLGDLIRPLKSSLYVSLGFTDDNDKPVCNPIEEVENIATRAIYRALFNPEQNDMAADPWTRDVIKRADDAVLAAELRCFWGPSDEADRLDVVIKTLHPMTRAACMPPNEAKALFLTEHERLFGRVKDRAAAQIRVRGIMAGSAR